MQGSGVNATTTKKKPWAWTFFLGWCLVLGVETYAELFGKQKKTIIWMIFL